MEKIIEIPDGYEARIEGNKVVLELKESEDEMILREISRYIKEQGDKPSGLPNGTVCVADMLAWLEKQKEQKPEHFELKAGKWYICHHPYCCRADHLTVKEGERFMCEKDGVVKGFVIKEPEKYFIECSAPAPMEDEQKEQKPAEWSEEDEKMLGGIIERGNSEIPRGECGLTPNQVAWLETRLESIRPQPKQESEPIEIKYAGKIYKVYGTKELPGGVVGYIIEDEPGHYDCIVHPDEVLGGGYGIKNNGSPYPTKEANFGQPHWKPSEEQMKALNALNCHGDLSYVGQQEHLISLYNDIKKL